MIGRSNSVLSIWWKPYHFLLPCRHQLRQLNLGNPAVTSPAPTGPEEPVKFRRSQKVLTIEDWWQHMKSIVLAIWESKKLTHQHVQLTLFSIMKVNLAAQVMSSTVAKALHHKYGDQVFATVEFIKNLNQWFDTMNSRSFHESHRTRNPNVAPFFMKMIPGYWWLRYDFMQYFVLWAERIDRAFPHFTHWPLGDLDAILKLEFSILFYWLVSSDLLMIMPSNECHRTLLMISQHWFR